MNILFYINTIGIGGAERVIVNLAKDFAEAGNECTLLTSNVVEPEYELSDKVERLSIESSETSRYRNPIKRNIFRIKALRNVCLECKADILISFMAEPNLRGVLATSKLKTKTIISVRSDPSREYAGRLGNFIGRCILPQADGCVFQTQEARSWFPVKLQEKSAVILNDVNPIFFRQERDPDNKIVAIGRISRQKNHKLLIDAFSDIKDEFPDIILEIYGSIDPKDDLGYSIEKYISGKGLSERVHLMGRTSHPELALSHARIFVLSSDYEGMPNALLEAMAGGVPSISTDCPCGGPREIIESGVNGILVQVGDRDGIANAMRKLLYNEDYANELGRNAKLGSERFSSEIVFGQWKKYVEKVIND